MLTKASVNADDKFDGVIVGSGVNSLACGALLAKAGWKIAIVERSDYVGGAIKTAELNAPGFKHDVFSAWHFTPFLSPVYEELGPDLEKHGLKYAYAEYSTGVLTPSGGSMAIKPDKAAVLEEFAAAGPGEDQRYEAVLKELGPDLDLSIAFLSEDVFSLSMAKKAVRRFLQGGPKDFMSFLRRAFESYRKLGERSFQTELARAVYAPWVLHLGLGPEDAMSGHMVRLLAFGFENGPVRVPVGGNGSTAAAFAGVIQEHGGVFFLDTHIEKIAIENGRATGVVSRSGDVYRAEKAVICNATPRQLYTSLLDQEATPAELRSQSERVAPGRGGMQIHLALSAPPRWPDGKLGRTAIVHLTSGLDEVSRAVAAAARGALPARPTVIVGQPCAIDPSRAPDGAWIFWIQLLELPAFVKSDEAGVLDIDGSGEWTERLREAYADRVLSIIEEYLPGVKDTIIGRTVLSPADLSAKNINLEGGDPYSGSTVIDQFGPFRSLTGRAKYKTPIKGLYHIGASTHPGPGVGAGSGYLAAKGLGA